MTSLSASCAAAVDHRGDPRPHARRPAGPTRPAGARAPDPGAPQGAERSGQMDGLLQDLRELLDKALTAERADAVPRPVRRRTLPRGTARQRPRRHRAGGPRTVELRLAFGGGPRGLRADPRPAAARCDRPAVQGPRRGHPGHVVARGEAAMKEMMGDLNRMLERHQRGEDVTEEYEQFKEKHQQFFPNAPDTIEEFIDELARRAAAMQRMLQSLTPEQRAELAEAMAQALADMDLQSEMAALQENLRSPAPGVRLERAASDQRRTSPRSARGDRRTGRARRPGGPQRPVRRGLRPRQPRRHRRGGGRARPGPAGPRRARDAATAAARAGGPGIPHPRRRDPAADAEGNPSHRPHGAEDGLRLHRQRHAGQPRHPPHRCGRRVDRHVARPWTFGDEQPVDVVRTVRNAVNRRVITGDVVHAPGTRGLRGARDRDRDASRRRPAHRPVVLDVHQRHLARREDDGAGAARARLHRVPARRPAGHLVRQRRPGGAPA